MEVRPAVEEYLQSIKRLRPLTIDGYKRRLSVFCAWCESNQIGLEQVRSTVVDEFVDHLRNTHRSHYANKPELSTHTLAGYVRCILCFLNWCLEEEQYDQVVKASVVKRIRKPKTVKTIIETFSKEQLQALFDACSREFDLHLQVRDKAILYVLLDTGIRANELCTLTIGHTYLNADDPYIRVLGKGQKVREVGLGVQSRQAIENYLATYRKAATPFETLFVGRYNDLPLTVSGLERLMRRVGKWANIQGVRCSPHTLRYTYACNYLLNGGDFFKLSLLLGHEDIEITRRYLRTIQSRQARKGKSVLDEMSI